MVGFTVSGVEPLQFLIRELVNAYKILIRKPKEKEPLG
jgi:hypothetical protein